MARECLARAAWCSLVVLLLSCVDRTAAPSAPNTPPATHGEPPEAELEPAPPPGLPPGQTVSFADELGEVEAVRGLKALRPVIGRTISDENLLRHLEATLHADLPARALEGTGELLVALGVVPKDFDYEATMLGLLRRDLAGLYDPRLGAMFVRKELEGDPRRATLLHELVHALQDQHYDLATLTRYREGGGDQLSALSSLAEGDATSAMFDGMFLAQKMTALDLPDGLIDAQFSQAAAPREADPTPPLLLRSMLAPYVDGLRFVHALRRRGGFEEIDRVWKDPPSTTEQVLHLEKYDQREAAVPVPLPRPPSLQEPGWTLFFQDVWGEQSLRLLLEEWMTSPTAASAATGWGGDRIVVFERGRERAVAWILESDEGVSGEKLYRALLHGLGTTGQAPDAQARPTACSLRSDRGALAVGFRGRRVALVAGPYTRSGVATPPERGPPTPPASSKPSSCIQALGWISTLLDQP